MGASPGGDGELGGGPEEAPGLSRRRLLERAAGVAAAAALPALPARVLAGAGPGGAHESLTADEARIVDAVVERLIPADGNGAGATEAQVGRYIDRALGGELGHHRAAYAAGLAALDALAQSEHRSRFADLRPDLQDGLIRMMEANAATGFRPDSRTFFNLLLEHAYQGMFGDPYYGGNADFAGWDLLGYPGVKIEGVTPAEQSLGAVVEPVHKSAYDYPLFGKP